MLTTGASAGEVVERRGLRKIVDRRALTRLIDEILSAHPDEVAAYRAGKATLVNFFVGRALARSGGRADPQRVRSIVLERLRRPGPAED
jgi:aspartyl-tRNA(Asn)/glutamyl-tRNA(Gln) amidotransferase subunit B